MNQALNRWKASAFIFLVTVRWVFNIVRPEKRDKLLWYVIQNYFGLYGQVTKRARWMPWQSEAMKDVAICEKVRGVDKQAVIRTCPNGETHSTL